MPGEVISFSGNGNSWETLLFLMINWSCALKKYRGAGRGGKGQASQSASAGGWGLSSGKTPGGTNSAVDGMMTGEGMSGPDQATDIWSGPPSSL